MASSSIHLGDLREALSHRHGAPVSSGRSLVAQEPLLEARGLLPWPPFWAQQVRHLQWEIGLFEAGLPCRPASHVYRQLPPTPRRSRTSTAPAAAGGRPAAARPPGRAARGRHRRRPGGGQRAAGARPGRGCPAPGGADPRREALAAAHERRRKLQRRQRRGGLGCAGRPPRGSAAQGVCRPLCAAAALQCHLSIPDPLTPPLPNSPTPPPQSRRGWSWRRRWRRASGSRARGTCPSARSGRGCAPRRRPRRVRSPCSPPSST